MTSNFFIRFDGKEKEDANDNQPEDDFRFRDKKKTISETVPDILTMANQLLQRE